MTEITGLNLSIVLSVVAGFVLFYFLKSFFNSLIKGILYSTLIAMGLFLAGVWYFLGFERFFELLRSVFNL